MVAILLATLRMEQTEEQIKLMDSNNRFNNFYKHREEFEKAYKEFPILKKIAQYERNHIANRNIAPVKRRQALSNSWFMQARVFYADWYYQNYSDFDGNFNKQILKRIKKINLLLTKKMVKQDSNSNGGSESNKKIDFSNITEKQIAELCSEFPSIISEIAFNMTIIDRLEFESLNKSVEYGVLLNLNMVYWGLLLIRQLLNNEGMTSGEINSFIYQYNEIRSMNELFTTI